MHLLTFVSRKVAVCEIMKLKILKYEPTYMAHRVEIIEGMPEQASALITKRRPLVDLGMNNVDPESFIGKTVECDAIQVYVGIAVFPRILEEF